MKYLLLLYRANDTGPAPDSPEGQAQRGRWFAVTDEMATAGVLLGGDALESETTATTVRERDGEVVLTDGPFAETKEVLGGYYLIEASDDAQAAELAKLCPAPYGYIEVRPIWEFNT